MLRGKQQCRRAKATVRGRSEHCRATPAPCRPSAVRRPRTAWPLDGAPSFRRTQVVASGKLQRPLGSTTLLGDTCASASNCLAVGIEPDLSGAYAGVILRSTDGGNSWKWANLPPNAPEVGAVACPTTTRCIAVGATVLTSDEVGPPGNSGA